MEEMKSFELLMEPDDRWRFFVNSSGSPVSLVGIYNSVSKIELHLSIPPDIKSQFNTAKMLCVYSWLYYPLHQIAELKAYSSLEFALKNLLGERSKKLIGLNQLLEHATMLGVFPHLDKQTIKTLSMLRNTLAHGEPVLHPDSISTLRLCADLINQLYENTEDSTE